MSVVGGQWSALTTGHWPLITSVYGSRPYGFSHSGSAVRVADAREEPGVHGHRGADAGAGDRGRDHRIQPAELGALASHTGRLGRSAIGVRVIRFPRAWRILGQRAHARGAGPRTSRIARRNQPLRSEE